MAALWFEEFRTEPVWHLAAERLEPGVYRARCGWTLDSRHSRVWPQKAGELGPARGSRCRSCVGPG